MLLLLLAQFMKEAARVESANMFSDCIPPTCHQSFPSLLLLLSSNIVVFTTIITITICCCNQTAIIVVVNFPPDRCRICYSIEETQCAGGPWVGAW